MPRVAFYDFGDSPEFHVDHQRVLQQLGVHSPFPLAALRWADANRDQIVPLLAAEIERWLTTGAPDPSDADRVFFAFHLMGMWQRKSAYSLLARFLGSPPAQIGRVLGDCETETSHRVMAAVFNGDPQPLQAIILNRHAGEYVRSRMLETLAMLVMRGELPRDQTAAFLRQCWDDLQPRHDCFVWNGWQSAIAMLGLVELRSVVFEAFVCGAIDPAWVSVAEFRGDLNYTATHAGALPPHRQNEYAPFGEPLTELEQICANVKPTRLEHGAPRQPPPRKAALGNRRSRPKRASL